MTAKNNERYIIERDDQLKALASTIRSQLFFEVARLSGATIREIAEQMGRSPASLYRHMDILVECDLVRVEGTKGKGPEKADSYIAIADIVVYPSSQEHPDLLDSLAGVYRAQFRNSEKEFIKGLSNPNARFRGVYKNIGSIDGIAWLTKSELREINSLLKDVRTILQASEPDRKGVEPIGLSFAMRPIDTR